MILRDPDITVSVPDPLVRPRLAPPHISSLCRGTCFEADAPCRSALQLPPLSAKARALLETLAQPATPPVAAKEEQ